MYFSFSVALKPENQHFVTPEEKAEGLLNHFSGG